MALVSQVDAIRRFVTALGAPLPGVIVAAGADDVGVLAIGSLQLAITTDYLNFRPLASILGVGGPADLGRLAVVQSVSDLLGSGAAPIAMVVATALPAEYTPEQVDALASGIAAASREYGVPILGGDTKQAPCLALNTTAIGIVGSGGPWLLGAARPGQILLISGAIGGVVAASFHYSLGTARALELDATATSLLLRPQLPTVLAAKLRAIGIAGAGTDISDGLGANLDRMLNSSGDLGVLIEESAIPISEGAQDIARMYGLSRVDLAFGLGGDGQFLLAVNQSDVPACLAAGAHRIGEINSGVRALVENGARKPLPVFGHKDFSGHSLLDEVREHFAKHSARR